LLCNHEVLTWLRELESEHLLRTKTALRVKKEEEAAALTGDCVPGSSALGGNAHLEASENLRTVEIEAISYLAADYLTATSQSEEGISKVVKNMAPYELTKAEKLQIVNLTPTCPVELYVIVEELEDRFGQQIDEILDIVKGSLSEHADPSTRTKRIKINGESAPEIPPAQVVVEGDQWDEDADAIYDEEFFDDTGAGEGIEGDLEMEED